MESFSLRLLGYMSVCFNPHPARRLDATLRGLSDFGERQRNTLGHIQCEAPVGVDMLIEQWR